MKVIEGRRGNGKKDVPKISQGRLKYKLALILSSGTTWTRSGIRVGQIPVDGRFQMTLTDRTTVEFICCFLLRLGIDNHDSIQRRLHAERMEERIN